MCVMVVMLEAAVYIEAHSSHHFSVDLHASSLAAYIFPL